MDTQITRIAQKIKTARHLVFFTGAGISTESGISDYRSQGGLWRKVQPIYFDDFMSSRSARIQYWKQRLSMEKSLAAAKPNAGHNCIARLDKLGRVKAVITQNIDGLHQASGISEEKIIELHGNTRRVRCMSCRQVYPWDQIRKRIDNGDPAPVCECSGYLKPDTISFGQAMPEKATQRAVQLSKQSDVFIVVGSTLVVQPAALMPEYAKNNGAFLGIINLSETPYDSVSDVVIQGKAGTVLKQIVDQVISI